MSKIKKLEKFVNDIYEKKNPARADWADWLYANHVYVVADFAEKLADRFNAPKDLCRAAAILHDIADASMSRFDLKHEQATLSISRDFLTKSGFNNKEIEIIVDDAIKFHSCKNGNNPNTNVGKILATADALAHLHTNFYVYTTRKLMPDKSESYKQCWALRKIARDYIDKIAFDEIRKESESSFNQISRIFLKSS